MARLGLYSMGLQNLAGFAAEAIASGETDALETVIFEAEVSGDGDAERGRVYLNPLRLDLLDVASDAVSILGEGPAWAAVSRLAGSLIGSGRLEFDAALDVMGSDVFGSVRAHVSTLLAARIG